MSNNVREIRARLKLTQAQLGLALHCTQTNVGLIERGQQQLMEDRALFLLDFAASRGMHLTMDQVYGLVPLPPISAAPKE